MVCGTDGPLVDSGCVNSLFDVLFGTNQRRDVGRLVFIAHSFIDNHREVEHTFIDHIRLATGHYHRPAKHANEDYPFVLQDGDHIYVAVARTRVDVVTKMLGAVPEELS